MASTSVLIDAQYLRKQRMAIDAILLENQRLKEELMLENKYTINASSQSAADLLSHLKSQAESYEAQIVDEQRTKVKLEARVTELKEGIAELRQQMGGVNSALEKSIRAQRLVVLLENRLEHASACRSEANLKRSRLQEAVDGLRRERLLFDELTSKTEKGVRRRAREAATLVTKSAEIHEERLKAAAMKAQVKARAERDVAACEAEWARLTEVIDTDRKQREELRERERKEREERLAALFRRDYVTPKKEKQAGDGLPRPDAPSPTPLQEKIRTLQENLDAVKKATGASCAEELVEWILEKRNENLRLFTQVNEAHTRVEALENNLKAMRVDVDRLSGKSPEAIAAAAATAERALSLRTAREEAEELERQLESANERVDEVCAAVQVLFNRLGCATDAVRLSIPDAGELPNDKTVLQHLGIIEQRATEIVQQYLSLVTEDSKLAVDRTVRVMTTGTTGMSSTALPMEFTIEPPSAIVPPPSDADIKAARERKKSGLDNEEERPLGRVELKERSAKAVAEVMDTAVKVKVVADIGGV